MYKYINTSSVSTHCATLRISRLGRDPPLKPPWSILFQRLAISAIKQVISHHCERRVSVQCC